MARLAACSIGTLVVALTVVAGGSPSTTRIRPLQAWAEYVWHPPTGVATSGFIHPHRVRTLPAGRYRVQVIATEDFGFQLIGPGINRHTRVSLSPDAGSIPTNVTWTIRLRRGLYQYRAVGALAAMYKGVLGSFRVR
jgi:hypothetical protein